MDLVSLIINSVIAVGTISAVIVALFLGLRQRADMLEAQYDAQRPLVVPDQPWVAIHHGQGTSSVFAVPRERPFDLSAPNNSIRLVNVGAGVAMNIRGVVLGRRSAAETNQPETAHPAHWSFAVPAPLSPLSAVMPMPSGELRGPLEVIAMQDGPTYHILSGIMPRYTLSPTPQVASEAPGDGDGGRAEYRLTMTYHDLFGHIHAIVFDYLSDSGWTMRTSARRLKQDLDDALHTDNIRKQSSGA